MNKNPNVAYAGLVQKYIGSAYDVVKEVHDNLDTLLALNLDVNNFIKYPIVVGAGSNVITAPTVFTQAVVIVDGVVILETDGAYSTDGENKLITMTPPFTFTGSESVELWLNNINLINSAEVYSVDGLTGHVDLSTKYATIASISTPSYTYVPLTLTSGQTTAIFPSSVTATSSFYLQGLNVDDSEIFLNTHYTIVNGATIELVSSYPAGTVITAKKPT